MENNIYCAIAFTAILMFLDYYLTLKAARLYKQGSSEHIQVESFELNPMFRKSINESKYNIRHLVFVILASALIYLLYFLFKQNIILTPEAFPLVPGIFFTIFGYVNANHLRNIVIMKAIRENPGMLKGRTEQTYIYSLTQQQAQLLVLFIPLLIIFVMNPGYFVFGGMIGLGSLFLLFKTWKQKYLTSNPKAAFQNGK